MVAGHALGPGQSGAMSSSAEQRWKQRQGKGERVRKSRGQELGGARAVGSASKHLAACNCSCRSTTSLPATASNRCR